MKEGYEKKCCVCKKRFSTYSAGEYWTYQIHIGKSRRFFCSYACQRIYESRKPEKIYEIKDQCSHFCEEEDEDYRCDIHGKNFTCKGCCDFKEVRDGETKDKDT